MVAYIVILIMHDLTNIQLIKMYRNTINIQLPRIVIRIC